MKANGFTLIEMMIAVIIIGLLAAIALPNFVALSDRAREASVKSTMHSLQLGMEEAFSKSGGVYPEDDATVGAAPGLLDSMPEGHYPRNPFSSSGVFVTVTWTQVATVVHVIPTATTDSLGASPAFSRGNIAISVGDVSGGNKAYSITGSGSLTFITEKGILFALHN